MIPADKTFMIAQMSSRKDRASAPRKSEGPFSTPNIFGCLAGVMTIAGDIESPLVPAGDWLGDWNNIMEDPLPSFSR